ncbi:MAG: hypothetical protein CM15mP45_09730 [Deltaproteobacteria bacterium]|nr:MAG: hypothetical protein CM15mP45_09730 [Deltaproteobacteria bacterium]
MKFVFFEVVIFLGVVVLFKGPPGSHSSFSFLRRIFFFLDFYSKPFLGEKAMVKKDESSEPGGQAPAKPREKILQDFRRRRDVSLMHQKDGKFWPGVLPRVGVKRDSVSCSPPKIREQVGWNRKGVS